MSACDEMAVNPQEGAELTKNSEGWNITDVSLGSSDRIVISGCKHATGETFLSIFLIIASDPQTDAKYLYSREFSKNYNPNLSRLVSFLDELNLVTCFDNLIEKISIVEDEVVQSSKLLHKGASCLFIKEKQAFVGFRESCDVVVLDSDLNNVQLIFLTGLQVGWPMDLVVVQDSLLLCSVGGVPRKALSLAEKNGKLLMEYTNPRSDDSVPLSLTVSAEADLVAVLWNSPPQLTIHSFSHGHCLVAADVEPGERVRSLNQKLVMVDGKGEMKFFNFEEFFSFENLAAILSSLLSPEDCKELMDFFGVTSCQVERANDKGINTGKDLYEVNLKDLLKYFEEDSTIQPGDVTELIEAFTHLKKGRILLSPLEAYQKYAGLTGLTDNASNSSGSSCHTANDLKTMDPQGGALRQDEEAKRKNSVENEGTSEVDEDEDTVSWTSDEEPLSTFIPDESQEGKTNGSRALSAENDLGSPQGKDNPSVSGIGGTLLINGRNKSPENEKYEKESDEMDVSDGEDVIMEEEGSNLKVDDDTSVEETMTMMMEEIQALKQQNGLILSYLRTQPLSLPHQHSQHYSLHPPSSQHTQTLPHGQFTQQAGVHQPTQIRSFSQKHPLPIQQLQTMVYQAGPGLPAQPGGHGRGTQQANTPNNAQPGQPSAQNRVVHPLPLPQLGQQPQPGQPTQSQPPVAVQQAQTSQPSQLSQPPPPFAEPQAGPSLSISHPPQTKQPSSSVSSSPSILSQPSAQASQIAQPSQVVQQSQPVRHIQPTQPPPLVNLHTHPQVPVYPYNPQVSQNFYGLPVRYGTQAYTHPVFYYPLNPNVVRPSHSVRHPSSIPSTVPVKSSVQLTSGSPAQLPIHTQSQASVVTTSVASHQPTQANSTPTTQPANLTLSHGVPQSPVDLTMHSQLVTPSVSSTQLQPTANTPSMVTTHDMDGPSHTTELIGYGFEALHPKVKGDIQPYTSCMQSIIHRNAIARILADYFFSDNERMECNCSGKNGFKPFNPEKLQKIRHLMFELCTKHWVGYPQLDETLEWRRLCKVIDSHNRSHRTRIRVQLLREPSN